MTNLKNEILSDPLSIGYSGMTDKQVAEALNIVDRVLQRKSISGDELFGYTDVVEYASLSDAKKLQWLALCAIETVHRSAMPIIKTIFPSASTTWENIVKTETVTRAQELGLQKVRTGHVIEVRL